MNKILSSYPRAILHMHRQIRFQRLGLIFGAGLSKGFGLPNWPQLISRIANDPDIDGKAIYDGAKSGESMPYMTEMLFEHFKKRRYMAVKPEERRTRPIDYVIAKDWVDIVRRHLYTGAAGTPSEVATACESHPYLKVYLPLIQKVHMTVTYNFDDFIEQAIANDPNRGEAQKQTSRGYETVTNPWMQFRRNEAIIYHPNGVIPQAPLETPSDRFVFSESSYAERMIGIFAGDHAGLMNHLSKKTCLIVGLSLTDETFRNLLVQSARANPGNYHYYVHFKDPEQVLCSDKLEAIRKTNFKVYNLVTLYLDDEEIAALGRVIQTDDATLRDCVSIAKVSPGFRYYLTGPIGIGKSTSINYLRNLDVLDEWLEPRIPLLAKAWADLTPEEVQVVDEWIAKQFRLKNEQLRHNFLGVFVLDRGPLDPIAFTKPADRPAKAKQLLDSICEPDRHWHVEPGHVILLVGDADELAVRVLLTGRNTYTNDRLNEMAQYLDDSYGSKGVTKIDVRGLSVADVVRRIAEVIHLGEYEECPLHERLLEFEAGK